MAAHFSLKVDFPAAIPLLPGPQAVHSLLLPGFPAVRSLLADLLVAYASQLAGSSIVEILVMI